ncbi:hypothetical protein, partial [Ochrobactrum sp. CGA5]|uniref:hypothetical protein n=1 Tax=Ochrobactrum sp. CGA5 TaxID=2583453 RepID=UPI001FFFDF76
KDCRRKKNGRFGRSLKAVFVPAATLCACPLTENCTGDRGKRKKENNKPAKSGLPNILKNYAFDGFMSLKSLFTMALGWKSP